jgi:hypothetical protein
MSMANDRTLSAEDQVALASTLVDAAVAQQDEVEKLLGQAKTVLNALTADIPNKIAQQAAEEVVQKIANLVTQKVADVLPPAEAKVQTLLKAMEDEVLECQRAAAEYRRAAAEYQHARENAVLFCVIAAGSAALVILVIMMVARIVWGLRF